MLCGFTATMKSIPSLLPKYPFSLTRTSYQVGKPWILEGKIFFGVTGIPILKIAFVNKKFALADPVPFTLAKRITKSFTLLSTAFFTTLRFAFFAAVLVTFFVIFLLTFLA